MSVHVNRGRSVLCSLQDEDGPESMDSDGMAVRARSRGPSPLSDSMVSEADDEGLINEITHEIPCYSHEAESVISPEIYGADLQRTLGEILAYCQVTYGAILKLDEKFEMLQAKVASIQNPAVLSQRTHLSSRYRERCQAKSEARMPRLVHISSTSPLPSVESWKPPALSPGPEVPSPPRLLVQNPAPTHDTPEPLGTEKTSPAPPQPERGKSPAEISPASTTDLYKTSCLGGSDRKVFLSNSILQRAGKMARPGAAVRYLTRNVFTVEELSQSSTNGNPTRRLKRLDPNKINAIREWAVKRYPKFDLRERGKDWKVCLSVINSMARYYRFMDKTRKLKTEEGVKAENSGSVAPAAEIDVELSDSDAEQKQQQVLMGHAAEEYDTPADWDSNSVYLGPPHRDVKVPGFALSAAHLRTRPELIARYLIKFIFPEDVLVRSNVYGGVRRGIQALDHNKISALREHLLERFPWMKLEEDGSDWKVCVGAINSTIRKFRYERKMGIKRGMR
ncbi:BEN domain-containing protein 2 isoform X1 [Pimephales promelas]|uniref:BEN domain-containing protein 2 isoform X1 n=1 Tax=Pimephales promelas TaxID=90988 RepID=UPI001955DAFF|nr:BEN domain-containing protein 2 isoform X1 [Pimephales promelas]